MQSRALVPLRLAASIAALATVTPLPSHAETLREALASAYRANPRLDAERSRLRATDEDVARANAGFRPVVEGSVDAGWQTVTTKPTTASSGDTSPIGYQLTARQSIFSGYRTVNAVAEAEAGVRAGRENLRFVESAVLLEAVTAYADVARDQQIVKILESNVAVLTQELQAAEARRAVREVTKTDVAQAQARRARAISEADAAKANLKISRASYLRVVGNPASGVSMPGLRMSLMPRSLEEALRTGSQESPNIVSALYRETAARHAVDKVWGELLPEVSIEASFQHRADASSAIDEQEAGIIAGRVTMPLYEGGETRARVRQAKHTHVSRIQEIDQARTETEANITAAWSRLSAARAQLKSDQVQVEANRTALEGVREEEKVGQRTLLDVLNAEQEYLDSQVALSQTRRDLVVAGYALLSAMGKLNAVHLDLASDIYDPEEHYQEVREQWFGLSITRESGERETMIVPDAAPDGDFIE